ncbi:MAG TPA: hydrolase [Burkholderiales bacterium]|nr:hydrolase [Burkholderiales bacterium]
MKQGDLGAQTANGVVLADERAPHASSAYRAPWWLPGGHLQTIYPFLFRRPPRTPTLRERWDTPDGDFVDVDLLEASASAPLLVLFHGLEGGSHSHYARALMQVARARGWRVLLPHFRGCSGEANRLPRAYHSGDTVELDWMLRRAQAIAGDGPMYAMGVSLGGNVLLKWLGEQGAAANELVRAAAAVSAPLDLMAAGHALERGFNRIYTRMFLATLVAKSMDIIARFPGAFDGERAARARTLREFDDAVTAPLHGFADVTDYWTRASAKPLLRDIRVRTLVMNARNDPFLPAKHLPAHDEVSAAVTLELPVSGGHVGFLSGPFPGHLRWLPQRVFEFFNQADRS